MQMKSGVDSNEIQASQIVLIIVFTIFNWPVQLILNSHNIYVINFLGSYPDGLHEVDVQILNNQVCSDLYGPMITETMMCTSGSNGRGSCYGDSGGPGIL